MGSTTWTKEQTAEYERRRTLPQKVMALCCGINPAGERVEAERETGHGGLHEEIMAWCNGQWPKWKYIHSRTDRRSTVEVGACDFVIFAPGGRTLLVECKAKGGKLTLAQQAWAKELSMLGHEVFLVRSLQEFLDIVIQP